MRKVLLIGGWLLGPGLLAAQVVAQSSRLAGGYGRDLSGKTITELTAAPGKPVVIVILATDCPISNRYLPEIKRLQQEFTAKTAFWLLYPNATDTAETVRRQQVDFGVAGRSLVEPTIPFLRLLGSKITPEAAVLVEQGAAWRVVYRGRIDDRYMGIGRERPQATRHDLEEAVTAVLHGQPAPAPGGPPVGCGIVSREAIGIAAGTGAGHR